MYTERWKCASRFLCSPLGVAAGPSYPPDSVQTVQELFSGTVNYFTDTSIVNTDSTNSIRFWDSFQHNFFFNLGWHSEFLPCTAYDDTLVNVLFFLPGHVSFPNQTHNRNNFNFQDYCLTKLQWLWKAVSLQLLSVLDFLVCFYFWFVFFFLFSLHVLWNVEQNCIICCTTVHILLFPKVYL